MRALLVHSCGRGPNGVHRADRGRAQAVKCAAGGLRSELHAEDGLIDRVRKAESDDPSGR